MKPKVNGMDVRLFVIQPVYQEVASKLNTGEPIKDEFGKKIRLVEDKFVKELYLKLWFDKRDLTPYGEYVGSKGKILKNRSKVYCKSTQSYYTVAHSIDELGEVLQQPNPNGIGFAKKPNNEI